MSSRLRYPEFAPDGVATLRTTEHYLNAATALPAVLLELVRLRVSLRNGCEFCIGHHTNELRKHNEPETRIEAVGVWENSDAFTPRERAALAWADSVTDIQSRGAGDAEYAEVSTFFGDKDLVDLTLAIASINAWNRLSVAFRAEWNPRRASKRSVPERLRENTPPEDTPTEDTPSTATPIQDPPVQDTLDEDGGKVARS